MTQSWSLTGKPGADTTVVCVAEMTKIGKAVASANYCVADSDCAFFGRACIPASTCSTVVNTAELPKLQADMQSYEAFCGAMNCTPCPGAHGVKAVCDDGQCFVESSIVE